MLSEGRERVRFYFVSQLTTQRFVFSYMRDMGILSRVVPLLQHSNVKLLTRAVGVSRRVPLSARACALMLLASQVVHNMSSDSSSIASIRHEQALPMLINLLKVPRHSQSHSLLVF
jgi:hypothetical protein